MGKFFVPFNNKATLPNFDIEMSRNDAYEALDYVSDRLRRKGKHLTLIVTGEALSCLHLKTMNHCSNMSIIPASPLTPTEMTHLATSAKKAAKKFNLGPDWLNNRAQVKLEKLGYLNEVIRGSLRQSEVVYSTEGLALLGVDYTYALKSKLESLSMASRDSPTPSLASIDDAVCLLHRLICHPESGTRGRPVTKGYLTSQYPHMEMSDSLLLHVGSTYEWHYGKRGISGVNDEWLEWRREGRIDIDCELESWGLGLGLGILPTVSRILPPDDDDRVSSVASTEDGIIHIGLETPDPTKDNRASGGGMSPYVINYGFREANSISSTRECSPAPKSMTPRIGVQDFLRTFNNIS